MLTSKLKKHEISNKIRTSNLYYRVLALTLQKKINMTFWKTFWAVILALAISGTVFLLVFFGILGGIVSSYETPPELVKENTVLHLKLESKIGDVSYSYFDQNALQIVEQIGLVDILSAIKAAKTDDKIKGIFINVNSIAAGMATVNEIRSALEDFKASKKFVIAYSENFTNKSYYLSSVADEVYIYPTGMFQLLGLGSEIPFVKGTLDKLEVDMQIIRGSNNKFKSAVEPLMYDHMSAANREQTKKYIDALWLDILLAIEKDRGISIDDLNKIADSVLTRTPADAVKYNLANATKYYDEVEDLMKSKVGVESGKDLNLFSFKTYVKRKKAHKRNAKIAMISLEGEIVDGEGGPGQIGGNSSAELIRGIRKDTTVKAVVLRVNSPGGSALASDLIWREVMLTKAEKPVVVSMGNVAASGGYYVACGANKIYAAPNTITGSIGVFGVIPYVGDLMKNKLGVTFDRVQTNAHSIVSMTKRLSEEELLIIQKGVDDIYLDFITKVGEGRGMKTEMVDSIGQGRVWAGRDAIDIGLIDEYGGLNKAIAEAASLIGLTDTLNNYDIRVITTNQTDPAIAYIQNFTSASVSIPQKGLNQKLKEIYNYGEYLENTKGIQARMPYLFWIE